MQQCLVVAERGQLGLDAHGAVAGPRGVRQPTDSDAERECEQHAQGGEYVHGADDARAHRHEPSPRRLAEIVGGLR
jgi:hypothetical protein